jgi:hypothetical protein
MAKHTAAQKGVPSFGTIAERVHMLRDKRAMLDADLATQYGVETRRLNKQVRGNAGRFPEDFAFQTTNQEFAILMSQIATSSTVSRGHGGRRKAPAEFTEHGALMAAAVLNSPRAVEVSVFVVRAFVQPREVARTHKEISRKLDALEQKVSGHDKAIAGLINAIRELMIQPEPTKKKLPIGFMRDEEI